MTSFCSQLRLLLWKTWISKKRRGVGTLCEIFLPVILTTILIWVRDEVDIEQIPMQYGVSVPVFSTLDVGGRFAASASLPGVIRRQDICYGSEINKYIAVTPHNNDTEWFLGELDKFYQYVSSQTILEYYSAAYFLESVGNFRDLFILINNTLDLCIDCSDLGEPWTAVITTKDDCASFMLSAHPLSCGVAVCS